jgi:GxxExxY protein
MTEAQCNKLTYTIIRCAMEVHRHLGPGLMESVYDVCLCRELEQAGLFVERQKLLPVMYKGNALEKDFFIDLFVENEVVVELKAVETILPIHESQLLTYLKLSEKRIGLLLNFNVPILKDGRPRKINGNLTAVK